MARFLLFALLLTTASSAFAQSKELDSLRTLLVRTKVDTTRVQLMFQIGAYHSYQNLDSARWYAEQGLRLARKTNYVQGELDNRDLLGYTVSERNIPYSVQLRLENLRLAQRTNNRVAIRRNYMNLGLIQLYLENYRQVIPYYQEVKKLALEDNDKLSVANANSELASLYLALHQLDSARYYLTLADNEYPGVWQSPYTLYYWGRLVEAEKNPSKAKAYFQQSLQQLKAQQDLRGQGLLYRWFSELLWRQNQPDSSILMAKNGLFVGQKLTNFRIILFNSRLLTQHYQTLGRTDSAYKYQTIMITARDSLFSQQRINQIQTTLIEERQRTQRLEEEKSQFASRVKIYGLLGAVLVLVSLAGLLYRNNRQKQRTNGQLRTLNQEIEQQKEEIEAQRDHLESTLQELQVTQTQLIQREKLASLGELTAGIAHEIQNPLNFVNNFSEVSSELVTELEDEQQKPARDPELEAELLGDLKQNLQKITLHGQRAASIVKGMLDHSRTSTGQKQPTDLNALADEYLRLAYHGLRAKDKAFNATLNTDFDPNLGPVALVPQEVGRVLLNLFNNAFHAVQEKQKISLNGYHPTVGLSTSRQNGQVELRVSDNGVGMPESVKAKIFQPFFTTKPTGEGTGLGLSLSYEIVTKGHGGSLTVETTEGQGSTFVVNLPT